MANEQTLYLTLGYLRELKESNQDVIVDKDKFESAFNLLQESFPSLLEGDDCEYKYALKPYTLPELIKAGANAIGAKTLEQEEKEFEKNPLFQKFLGAVTAKGFFKGTTAGDDEYKIRYRKMVLRFKDKMKAQQRVEEKPTEVAKQEDAEVKGASNEEVAEALKEEGNALLKNKDFEGACEAYTKAIQACSDGPKSHIYFANRAAARQYLKQHRGALDDCEAAIAREPTYSKAHSRLAATYGALGDWHNSVKSYERCLELDPTNKAAKSALVTSQAKAKKTAPPTPPAANQVTGMPPMPPMGGMPGGMPGGLGAMMQNPAMMQMAQSMMSNPAMMQQAQQMMSNPAMMQAAMGAMGGAGGMNMSEEEISEAMAAMNNNNV